MPQALNELRARAQTIQSDLASILGNLPYANLDGPAGRAPPDLWDASNEALFAVAQFRAVVATRKRSVEGSNSS